MRTDRHDGAYCRFSQLFERVWTFEVCTSWTSCKQNNKWYIAMKMVPIEFFWTGWFILIIWVALQLKGAFFNPPLIVHCEVHTIDSFSNSSPLARIYRPQIIFPYVLLSAILPSSFHIQGGVFPVFTLQNVYSCLVLPTLYRQYF